MNNDRLVQQYRVKLQAHSFSTGNRMYHPGFETIITEEHPDFGFYSGSGKFTLEPLGRISSVDAPKYKSHGEKPISTTGAGAVEDEWDEADGVYDRPLHKIEEIGKKELALLNTAGYITVKDIMYPDGMDSDSEEVADLTDIKGIGQGTANKIIDILEDLIEQSESESE